MADEWCEEGAGLQRKQRKRGCIHQIKIPEYSTDQQNHTQLSSPHISLYFQDMWSSRFWRPNISPPARCEREKTISRNPAFIPLTALFIITAALVLSFFPPHLHSFIFQRLIVHITTSDVAPVSWVNPTPMLHILHMQHRHISTFRLPLGWALHAIPYTQCVWVLSRVRRFVTPWTLAPHGLQPTRLLCPWNFPGKTTGVGCHFPSQEIFLTQRLNPSLWHLLHWQEGFFSPLAPPGKPHITIWLVLPDTLPHPHSLLGAKFDCPFTSTQHIFWTEKKKHSSWVSKFIMPKTV